MYLIIGDKRRDLDLGFIMEIHNILELLANPHLNFTLIFWTMWTIFMNFAFYFMTHLYRIYGSALGGSDMSEINVTKQKTASFVFGFKIYCEA